METTTDEGTTPTIRQLCAYFVQRNLAKFSTVICVDADRSRAIGTTGYGKSALAILLALALDATPDGFSLRRDVVYKADERAWRRLLYATEPFGAWVVDEAEWFLDRRDAMTKRVKEATRQFMSKRYTRRYDILVLPQIWDLDRRLRLNMVQWRFRIQRRGYVEVFANDGHEKEETDKWGRFVTATTFPKLPRRVERLYERLKAGHDAPPLSA